MTHFPTIRYLDLCHKFNPQTSFWLSTNLFTLFEK